MSNDSPRYPTKGDIRMLQRWLDKTEREQKNTCPFYLQTKDDYQKKQDCYLCGGIFPEILQKFDFCTDAAIHGCPEDFVSFDIVLKRYKRYVKEYAHVLEEKPPPPYKRKGQKNSRSHIVHIENNGR